MVFSDYMNNLSTEVVSEKSAMISKISEACCVKENAVYSWIAGRTRPNALARKTISAVLNVPEDELFPQE